MVVEESNYPDTDKGNLIIAGHSGTGDTRPAPRRNRRDTKRLSRAGWLAAVEL